MRKYQVLIVGCGPTGATLANLLRQYGYSVAIFDRDKGIFAAPRAMQIDPHTCRIFQSIGVQARLEKEDARPAVRHIFVDPNRQPLFEFHTDEDTAEHGYHVGGMRFHQPSLEQFLREDFSKGTGVDAYLGYDVEVVDGEGEYARLQARNLEADEVEEFQADYIVGADGGGSLCRKYIGAKRIDFDYSRQWIVMDMILHDQALWDGIIDRSEFRCRENAAVVYVKGTHNHVRLDFEVGEERAKNFSKADALELISDYFDPSSVEFQRLTPYHFYAGMPEHWSRGRVFLAGDAAHLTSPFSGQGLNMGIRDAANLAFKFDLVFRGLADARLLESYEEERWENCEKVIKGATTRGLMISTGSWRGILRRKVLFSLAKLFPKIALKSSHHASVGYAYEQGVIGSHDIAGYLFFQPELLGLNGQPLLLDDLIGHRFALISLAPLSGLENRAWFERILGGVVLTLGQQFEDPSSRLQAYMTKHNVEHVLVRPDHYVFDAGDSADLLLEGLKLKLGEYGHDMSQQM